MIEFASIEQYCDLLGQRYTYPGVGIIPSGKPFGTLAFKGDFYAVYFCRTWCGNARYGCGCHDFTTATMVFKAPGEVVELVSSELLAEVSIAGILFTPELLNRDFFNDKRHEYTFFAYRENESLHLSKRELQVVVENMTAIREELLRESDRYTAHLLCGHLALLLDYSLRFYERQFTLRKDQYLRIVSRARGMIFRYFRSERTGKTEQAAVDYVRGELPFSASYLNDLLRAETGMALPEYTRIIRLEMMKTDVGYSNKPFSAIAGDLGLSLQALNFLFQKLVGCSPGEYRQAFMNKPN